MPPQPYIVHPTDLQYAPTIMRAPSPSSSIGTDYHPDQTTNVDNELTELRGSLEGDLKPMRDTREKYETELMAMQKAINEAKTALDLKKSDLDQYLLTERQEKSKLLSLESDMRTNMEKLDEKKKLVDGCTSDLPESERRIEANLKKAQDLEAKRKTIEAKLQQQNQA